LPAKRGDERSPNISNNGLTRTNRSSHPQGAPQHCSRDDALWAEEVEDRIDAFERGKMAAIPARDVFAEIENNRR